MADFARKGLVSVGLAVAAAAALIGGVSPGPAPFPMPMSERERFAIAVPEEPRIMTEIKRRRRDPKRRKAYSQPASAFRARQGRNALMMVRRGVPHFLAYGLPPSATDFT